MVRNSWTYRSLTQFKRQLIVYSKFNIKVIWYKYVKKHYNSNVYNF